MCRFRHLLEQHDLGRRLFDEVQRHLAEQGLKVATGTIVDATIINAPSSTKNADKARDPEMHHQEGPAMDEGTSWGRQPQQADPRGDGDASQGRRQHGIA